MKVILVSPIISILSSYVVSGAPIQQKKAKFAESQKLKQIISKTVNRSMEEEMRSRAREGQINLSKAQLAVAKHHKDKKSKEEVTQP